MQVSRASLCTYLTLQSKDISRRYKVIAGNKSHPVTALLVIVNIIVNHKVSLETLIHTVLSNNLQRYATWSRSKFNELYKYLSSVKYSMLNSCVNLITFYTRCR